MPAVKDRRVLGSEELPEFGLQGPFGGVQSELSLTQIEQYGFSSLSNFMLRLGRAQLRPGYSNLAVPSGETILGIAPFYNSAGALIQAVMTRTKLYKWDGSTFTEITGPGLTGAATDLFSWDVLNYKLCFSQGIDKIRIWDGIAATYSEASASAPVGRYLAEIGLHLLAVDPTYPQRYYWSGAGDPTDWTSLTSGLDDNVNNLGPINGMLKQNQYGFGYHQNGILQIIKTGNGLAPFAFGDIISTPQSVASPRSLAKFIDRGVEYGIYLGNDNVYIFNGSGIESIGDNPIDGRRRLGARSRILQDVLSSGFSNVVGTVTYSIAGNPYRAYWLLVPPYGVWVFNFDEGNWTKLTFSEAMVTLGAFSNQTTIRIMDLIGSIQDQSWTPATLQPNNPFLGLAFGFSTPNLGYMDFTASPDSGGTAVSGKLIFGDRRHSHTVKKFRLSFVDKGSVTYTVKITNEKNVSQTRTFTIGSGSGDDLSYTTSFTITGLRLQWTVSVPAGTPCEILEFVPIYDTGGEQRCGSLDN